MMCVKQGVIHLESRCQFTLGQVPWERLEKDSSLSQSAIPSLVFILVLASQLDDAKRKITVTQHLNS